MTELIYWLDQNTGYEREALGGKGANLAALARGKFPVPPGFCLSVYAYRRFVRETGVEETLTAITEAASVDNPKALEEQAKAAQRLIMSRSIPQEIASALEESYRKLGQALSEDDPAVAVRSSAIGEDQEKASYAGQHQSFLNIRGTKELITHVQKCWTSLWSAQALHYRLNKSQRTGPPAMAVVAISSNWAPLSNEQAKERG